LPSDKAPAIISMPNPDEKCHCGHYLHAQPRRAGAVQDRHCRIPIRLGFTTYFAFAIPHALCSFCFLTFFLTPSASRSPPALALVFSARHSRLGSTLNIEIKNHILLGVSSIVADKLPSRSCSLGASICHCRIPPPKDKTFRISWLSRRTCSPPQPFTAYCVSSCGRRTVHPPPQPLIFVTPPPLSTPPCQQNRARAGERTREMAVKHGRRWVGEEMVSQIIAGRRGSDAGQANF
jgi:hypothetical protein